MTEKSSIRSIKVQGVKSIYDEVSIEVKPLTLLAGTNSSGKSSVMQPLLILKQSLEAEYENTSLTWNGSHVKITEPYQFSNDILLMDDGNDEFDFKIRVFILGVAINEYGDNFDIINIVADNRLSIAMATIFNYKNNSRKVTIRRNQSTEDLLDTLGSDADELLQAISKFSVGNLEWRIHASRGLVQPAIYSTNGELITNIGDFNIKNFPIGNFKRLVQQIIHVPGLRGNPQRSYPVITMDFTRFEGTFLPYTASVIHHWQESDEEEDKAKLEKLVQQLRDLNLTAYVSTQAIDDTQTEVRVGRTLNSTEDDTVSLADVGFGVSQVLPVLVALLVAKEGQLVYLEQPELHLHPRAQVALAQILADAANRGVRVVVETHSSLLLIGIQTLIAEGKLKPEDTILHWFMRDAEGKTTVDSQTPDENGAYGDWQEDFADVELYAQSRYMEAVEKNLVRQAE